MNKKMATTTTTDDDRDNRKIIWKILNTRNIIDDENKSFIDAIPDEWSIVPDRMMHFNRILRFANEKGDMFWKCDNLVFDRGMMEVFHDIYVGRQNDIDPLRMYFSILTTIYDLYITKIKHQSRDGIVISMDVENQAEEMYSSSKLYDLNISKVSRESLVSLIPTWYENFNILQFLKENKKINEYIKETYKWKEQGGLLDKDFAARLSSAHFWVTHFKTVYDTASRLMSS